MARIDAFTDEQARALVNLQQRYEVWIEAERELALLPYDLRRKTVGGRAYLYEIADRSGNGKSLGPWSEEAEERFQAYRTTKEAARQRLGSSREALAEMARLCRALRTPALPSEAGAILREADRRGLLGSSLLVVGTNAMPAYTLEAGGFIREAPDETDDFDLAWAGMGGEEPGTSESAIDGLRDGAKDNLVWSLLKAVDPTYTVNTERSFQARNAKAYEVELLVAPSRAASMHRSDRPKPVPMPEQEWLLLGRPVSRVVICRDGSPARIVAPDPRFFALQKLWMSEKPSRNALKKPKDRKQGLALLDAVAMSMPQYPLDEAFVQALPAELAPHYAAWSVNRPSAPAPAW